MSKPNYNQSCYLTFNANKGTLPRKLVYQILGVLRGLSLAAIQTDPNVRLLLRSWAKLSQVLTTNRTSIIVVCEGGLVN